MNHLSPSQQALVFFMDESDARHELSAGKPDGHVKKLQHYEEMRVCEREQWE